MSKIDEHFINIDDISYEKTQEEWSLYRLPSREGFFAAYNSERSVRMLAGILKRADRMEQTLEQIASTLKFISYCALGGLLMLTYALLN